ACLGSRPTADVARLPRPGSPGQLRRPIPTSVFQPTPPANRRSQPRLRRMPTRRGGSRLNPELAGSAGSVGSTGEGMSGVFVSRVIAGVLGALLVVPAAAAAPKKRPSDDKRTVVRFDDDTIQGDLTRPDGDLVWSRPRLEMPSLVAPPRSFE